MSIIAGLFVVFFSRFLGPRRGAALQFLVSSVYHSCGGGAAVVRAAIMGPSRYLPCR